jgi:uncharacterized protein (TIGR00369 family)
MQENPDLIEEPYEFQKLLGFEIVHWAQGEATLHQPVAPHIGNRYGLPHGGVHAALLDTAMGFAGCWTGDPKRRQLAMTLTLNVSYLSRPRGKVLIARGWQTGGGRKTFFCSGEITDETGEVIATGSGAFRFRGPGAG